MRLGHDRRPRRIASTPRERRDSRTLIRRMHEGRSRVIQTQPNFPMAGSYFIEDRFSKARHARMGLSSEG